jgi:hypothetical protein
VPDAPVALEGDGVDLMVLRDPALTWLELEGVLRRCARAIGLGRTVLLVFERPWTAPRPGWPADLEGEDRELLGHLEPWAHLLLPPSQIEDQLLLARLSHPGAARGPSARDEVRQLWRRASGGCSADRLGHDDLVQQVAASGLPVSGLALDWDEAPPPELLEELMRRRPGAACFQSRGLAFLLQP